MADKTRRSGWCNRSDRPRDPQPAGANGLSVTRRHLTLTGEPANLSQIRQNDRLIVSVSGRNLEGGYHEVALLDLLPAGFEIESVLNEETAKSFPFLSKLTVPRIIPAPGRGERDSHSFSRDWHHSCRLLEVDTEHSSMYYTCCNIS